MIYKTIEELASNCNPKSFVNCLKKYPQFVKELEEWNVTRNCRNVSEEIYCIHNHIKPPKCTCGKNCLFNSYTKGYRPTCGSQACKGNLHSKTLKRILAEHSEIVEKGIETRDKTMMERYGVRSAMQSPELFQKFKDEYKAKTGYATPMENPEVVKKAKRACQEKYGVDYSLQSKGVRDKALESFEKNHGPQKMQFARAAWKDGKNPFAQESVKQSIKQYWIDNYGVEHPLQSEEKWSKFQQTLQEKYDRSAISHINMPKETCDFIMDKKRFEKELRECGIGEISRRYNISKGLVLDYHTKYELNIFTSTHRSQYEEDIRLWMEDEKIAYKKDDRMVCKPYEIDFLLLDHPIAIEFNGLYYHSENAGRKEVRYHRNKYDLCKSKGIQLLSIFEDEWIRGEKQCKNYIKSLICESNGHPMTLEKCTAEIQGFYEDRSIRKHEITGNVLCSHDSDGNLEVVMPLQEAIGIVTVETVSRRNAIKKVHDFLKNGSYDKEISLDLRWEDIKMYSDVGFSIKHEIAPIYVYTNYKKTTLLQEEAKDKIWDCGHIIIGM